MKFIIYIYNNKKTWKQEQPGTYSHLEHLANELTQCSDTRKFGFKEGTVQNTKKPIIQDGREQSNLPEEEDWEILWDTTRIA